MCRLPPALDIKEEEVMPCAPSQRTLDERSSPSLCAGRKLGDVEPALLWTLLQAGPECPSRVLRDKVTERQRPLAVRLRHRNRWRATWQRHRHKGRPRHASCPRPVASGAEGVRI